MAPSLKQDGRIGSLSTPLPPDGDSDPLALVRFDGSEGLSELFNFTVEALSTNSAIDFDKALGQPCTVKIKTSGPERVFNGILVAAQATGPTQDNFFGYRLTLRPWLWLHTQTIDYRIFQNKKAPQIIEEVLKERGFGEFEFRLDDEGSFPEYEYCVQYRESDFNFVSRLMEKEGIFYCFEHHDGKHVLVMTNANSKLQRVTGLDEINFNAAGSQSVDSNQTINHWTSARQVRSGMFELNDYNYETSTANMIANKKGTESYRHSNMEIYQYPGDYKNTTEGNRYAQIALEAEQALDHRRAGDGSAISLFAGGVTTLKPLPTDALKKFQPAPSEFQQYIVVRALHSYGTQDYSTAADAGKESFHGNYEFQPINRQFRAPIVTPKPRIYGVQTAVVVDKNAKGRVDKSDEEIEVEKLTEIYVSFYWDRRKHDEKRSVKLRVAQVWSGKNWGGQFIPRIGMEVVVEFLEGDPDRPLIVGAVYNDQNTPPYKLPDHKTQSGVKSNTYKGGNGYNEFMFEDKKGSEKISMHAQLDHEVVIENSETRTIGNVFKTPKGDSSRKTEIKNGDDELTIDMGNRKADIKQGNETLTIDMGNRTTELKMGNDSLKCDLGSITHEAMQKIELKVGQSSITIDQMGVTIKGMMIKIEGQIQVQVKGMMTQVNGDAMLMLKGGITMIN